MAITLLVLLAALLALMLVTAVRRPQQAPVPVRITRAVRRSRR